MKRLVNFLEIFGIVLGLFAVGFAIIGVIFAFTDLTGDFLVAKLSIQSSTASGVIHMGIAVVFLAAVVAALSLLAYEIEQSKVKVKAKRKVRHGK